MRTFKTSAGLPATPPTKPLVDAIAIRPRKEGDAVGVLKSDFNSSYTPNRVVEYVSCRKREAERPLYNPKKPSFFTT
jgi:hypothetical protein